MASFKDRQNASLQGARELQLRELDLAEDALPLDGLPYLLLPHQTALHNRVVVGDNIHILGLVGALVTVTAALVKVVVVYLLIVKRLRLLITTINIGHVVPNEEVFLFIFLLLNHAVLHPHVVV